MNKTLTGEDHLAYKSVREGVGWYRITSESAFEMSGKDAVSFLQGMVSNDVKSLKEGTGCYAACLTPTGKMLSDLRIYALADRLLVLLPRKEKGKILEHLDKFIFTEEVLFKDLESEADLFSFQGPLSQKLLRDFVEDPLVLDPYQHRAFEREGIPFRVFGATHTGENGFDMWVSKKESLRLCELIQEMGRSYGIREINAEVLEVLRIEASLPLYGIDMDESTIPLEAGLETAVNFTKGCYVGQEVIARIKYIGHTNRVLIGLKLSEAVSKGDQVVQDGREVGSITSSCYSPAQHSYVALAMMRRDIAKKEAVLMVKAERGFQQAILTSLPFYARH